MKKRWNLPCALGWVFAVSVLQPATAQPFLCNADGNEIGSDLPAGYEPSGAVWHARLNALFVVGDGGDVSRLEADGSDVTTWIVGGDLEGICVADPQTDLVYLGLENPDSIVEFDFLTGTALRIFDLTPWMAGPSNRGLEALTFVPDASNPEGGWFYAGLQNDGRIYVFELPIATSSSSVDVTHITTLTPVLDRTDLSGLDYDRDSQTLYAIFDGDNLLRAMEPDMTFIDEWTLPGNDQEGIALAGCEFFVAEDTPKEVWLYDAVGSAGDLDCDEEVTLLDHTAFTDCANSPTLPPWPSPAINADQCRCAFDADADQDVDLSDWAVFQRSITN